MDLKMPLELKVGGKGVIGRRLSVFKDRELRQRVAEGVIGWN